VASEVDASISVLGSGLPPGLAGAVFPSAADKLIGLSGIEFRAES
jgi:hypothetical protein